jgi:hypothetical protein
VRNSDAGVMLPELQEMEDRLSVWETEGGALNEGPTLSLTGTALHIKSEGEPQRLPKLGGPERAALANIEELN